MEMRLKKSNFKVMFAESNQSKIVLLVDVLSNSAWWRGDVKE